MGFLSPVVCGFFPDFVRVGGGSNFYAHGVVSKKPQALNRRPGTDQQLPDSTPPAFTGAPKMSDNRGRGPDTDEGRIEKNPSRPYENKPPMPNTPQRVNDALNKKK